MTLGSWFRWSRRPESGTAAAMRAPAVRLDGYIDELSEGLYRQTLDEGGWAVDIGVYGPALFKQDARRVVQEIALRGITGGPPSP